MIPILIPWKTHYYYRNRLNPKDRAVYDRIFTGLQNWEREIPVPVGSDVNYIHEIFTLVVRDCPLFFHVGWHIRLRPGLLTTMLPNYRLTQEQYDRQYRLVCDFVENSVRQLEKARRPYDKVRSIHNSMVRHVIYYGVEEDDSHNVVGCILKRKAVCESIAKAFKLICDANKIPCIVVFGNGGTTDGTPTGAVDPNNKDMNHAWNMVKLGKHWYNVDTTFDINETGLEDKSHIRYDYFCRSDAVFGVDHTPMSPFMPPAPVDFDYYKSIGSHAKDIPSLRALLRNACNGSSPKFSFSCNLERIPDLKTVMRIGNEEMGGSGWQGYRGMMNEKIGVVTIELY